ncbi:MAG: alpha/beta fold hydrolase, partial [Candidatus Binatia bacterium]
MKKGIGVGGMVVWVMMLCVVGCSDPKPSLTGAELAKKYPDASYVQLGGVSVHYKQEGLGRPLILMPGFLTHSYLWRNIVPGLTYGNTIYNLDLMGFGLSEKPQNQTYSLDTYVGQLGTFLDDFHLDNPVLVGHDASAVIATLYALRNPGKVRKLILINAPLHPITLPLGLRLLRTRLIGDLFTGDWFLKRLLRGGVLDPARMPDVLIKEYLAPYHDDPGARTALLKFVREFDLGSALESEVEPNLAKLQLPVLLLWGGQNTYVPIDLGSQLEQDIAGSTFSVIHS